MIHSKLYMRSTLELYYKKTLFFSVEIELGMVYKIEEI